jgi:hypothetical protein
MSRVVTIYGLLWMLLLFVAPIACIYGLTRTPTPQTARRTRGIAALGLLLSTWLAFSLAVTVLQPVAFIVLPAMLTFAGGIFRPSALVSKGVRTYLVACLAIGELFWMWAAWDQFVRVRS